MVKQPNEGAGDDHAQVSGESQAQPRQREASETGNEYDTPLWKRFIEMEFQWTDGISLDEKYKKEIDFVLDKAGLRGHLREGDRVLDICSGDGEHARRLSGATGSEVELRDYSASLVTAGTFEHEGIKLTDSEVDKIRFQTRMDEIKTNGYKVGKVNYKTGNMGDIKTSLDDPDEKFRAVTIMGSSFLYLDDHESHCKAVKDYYDILEDEGKLVFQFYEKDMKKHKEVKKDMAANMRGRGLEIVGKKDEKGKNIEEIDPADPKRRFNGMIKDPVRGDQLYITSHVEMPDEKIPVEGIDIDPITGEEVPMKTTIEKSSFGRGYINEKGNLEKNRKMTTTMNYMLSEQLPVMRKMLMDAGFDKDKIKLVPSPQDGEECVRFSEDGYRLLFAFVAEK
jgi:hypothetical protein